MVFSPPKSRMWDRLLKVVPEPRWSPLFAVREVRGLASACNVGILWGVATVPRVRFWGVFLVVSGGSVAVCDPNSPCPFQEPKKSVKIKNLGRTPPSQRSPPKAPDPANSLRLGPLFPSEHRKKAYIKNFEGGGLGGRKILYAGILRMPFFEHDICMV